MNTQFSAPATACLNYTAFKTALVNACKVIDRKCTIPTLAAVLIKAVDGGVRITGTDLDILTTTFVRGDVSLGFVALADAQRLLSIMEKVKDAPTVNLTRSGESLVVVIGNLSLTLSHGLDEAEYPSDPFRSALAAGHSFMLPSAQLAAALQKVSFAMSTEETRYYLNGAYLHVNDRLGQLAFVATDGHRLARYVMDAPAAALGATSVIIPRATVLEVLRLLRRKDRPADTMVSVCEKGISFLVGDDILLESKPVIGTYPDYGRTIPTESPLRCAVSTKPLADAIRQASAILSDRGRAVRLSFSRDKLRVSCSASDFGVSATEISIVNGCELDIGFNARYLLDIVDQLEGGAMFELADPGAPAVIKDGADEAVTYVQMPMRV